ncbi:MAG TPA: Ig-like domain-containing protein [Longimicrobium sp.]
MHRYLLSGVVLLAMACGDGSPTATEEGSKPRQPAQVTAVSGQNQEGTVGAKLASPLVVKVTTGRGEAVAGSAVVWTVTAGGGSLSSYATTTDAEGLAQVEWTVGTIAELNTASATVAGLAPATFTVTPKAGAVVKVEKVSGDAQTGVAGSPLPTQLVVRATDMYGNPVSGATVTWQVTVGSGSVTPATSTTDALGLARTTWSVGGGVNGLSGAATGAPPVTFTAVAPTLVSGLLSTNTTWTLSKSPYRMIGKVQLASGATLTIEPGVTVDGQGNDLEFWGSVRAVGTAESRIHLNGVRLRSEASFEDRSTVLIAYSDVAGGALGIGGGISDLDVSHSLIKGIGAMSVTASSAARRIEDNVFRDGTGVELMSVAPTRFDVYIQRNVFINTGGIRAGFFAGSSLPKAYIRNNSFYDQTTDFAISVSSAAAEATVVENNSFWSTNRVALRTEIGVLGSNRDFRVNAQNNFWNTTDEAVIQSMIYDRNDDPAGAGYVDYQPFLAASHRETPVRGSP